MYFLITICAIFILINVMYKKTNSFKNRSIVYETIKQIDENKKYKYINTGSSYAYFGIDYSSNTLNGINLSMAPQTISYDAKLLKKYIKLADDNAKVFLVLCPFVFCVDNYEKFEIDFRYNNILEKSELYKFNRVRTFIRNYLPLLENIYNTKFIIRDLPKLDYESIYTNSAVESAMSRINDWKSEFSITNFEDPSQITALLKENFNENIRRLNSMIELVRQNNCMPIIVIPPISNELRKYLSDNVLQLYLYDNLNKLNVSNVKILNYLDDNELSNCELFLNSDFLNKKGSQLFTKALMKDTEE